MTGLPVDVPAPRPRGWRWPVTAWAGVAAVLVVVVWQSSVHLPAAEEREPPRATTEVADGVFGPWLRWDTKYYVRVAEDGYGGPDVAVFEDGGETLVAFFPGYPLLVRGVADLGIGTGLALILVTAVSGLLVAVLFHRWCRRVLDEAASRRATWALLLFPWSYVLVAAGYPEALFLALAIGAFLLAEDDHPVAAGVLAALASTTRVIGIGVALGVALRVAERRGALTFDGWRPRLELGRFQRRDLGLLLGGVGLAGWMAFCWSRYGDPLAFSTAQRGWSQGFGPRSWFKLGLIDQIQHNGDRFFVLRLAAQGLAMVLMALALPAVWRRFGAGYGTFTIVAVALPLLGSSNFASNGRMALMAFPVFALAGERLGREPVRARGALLGASGALLVLVASWWGRGYWMA